MSLSVGDFVNLVKGTIGINIASVNFIKETFKGDAGWDDIEQWAKDVNKLVKIVDKASDELQLIIAISTAFAISDIIAIARAGPLANIMENKVVAGIANFVAPMATVYERLKEEEKRIKGILDEPLIRQSVNTARTFHRVALVVSNDYREGYAELQTVIRDAALAVFGEVSTINSALALLQMGIHDITALRGEAVDIGNDQFIAESIRLTEKIEDQSARYAQYPGAFWLDFQNLFMGPLNEQKTLINREQNGRVDRALDAIDGVNRGVDAVGKRLDDYVRVSEVILPRKESRALREWVRDWERDYGKPLNDINTILGEDIPKIEAEIEILDEKQQAEDDRLREVMEITNNPADNDDAAKSRQTARIDSILNNVLVVDDAPERQIRDATERINSIADGLAE